MYINIRRVSLSNIGVILLTFVLLFDPKIVGFNLQHVCGAIGWLYCLTHVSDINLKNRTVFNLSFVICLIAIYLSLVSVFNGNEWSGISMHFIYFIVDIIPACILIGHKANLSTNRTIYIKELLYTVAYIQAIFAIVALVFPQFQSFVIDRMVAYGYTKFSSLVSYRLYGMAADLTFTTPIFQSSMAVMAIYDSFYNKKNRLVSAILFIISAVINARVSIIVLIAGVIIILIVGKKDIKTVLKIFGGVVFAIFVGTLLFRFVINKESETYVWIVSGVQSIFDMLQGDTTSTYGGTYYYSSFFKVLFSKTSWILPSGVALFFGVGYRIMGYNKYGVSSDFGFNSDIWAGGILYSIVCYSGLIYLINKTSKQLLMTEGITKQDFLFFKWFTLAVFIIANLKGYVISANECTRVLILLFITYCCLDEKGEYNL